jgi:molybdopterin/thiamine biosynthesis adenylyltransferase
LSGSIVLKDSAWERAGDLLVVVCDPSKQIEIEDPDGHVEAILSALSSGPVTLGQLQQRLLKEGVVIGAGELRGALHVFDSIGILLNATGRSMGNVYEDERYRSNLAFFELFSSRARPSVAMQGELADAHVLQLGVGGVGSNVLQHLAGLGVGHLTLLDFDVVEPGNFARQYLFRHQDIGESKVRRAAQWLHEYDPHIQVDVVDCRVTGSDDVAGFLSGVDAVSAAIDTPSEVDLWVNEACIKATVPWVRAGITGSRLGYFSVDPGNSPCYACHRRTVEDAAGGSGVDAAATRLSSRIAERNTAIGPVAGLLGALVAFELLRYLTRFEAPHAAGANIFMDASNRLEQRREAWQADPECGLCQHAWLPPTPATGAA